MFRRGFVGIVLLGLAVGLLAVGVWRGYIRYAGKPEDYLLVALLGPRRLNSP